MRNKEAVLKICELEIPDKIERNDFVVYSHTEDDEKYYWDSKFQIQVPLPDNWVHDPTPEQEKAIRAFLQVDWNIFVTRQHFQALRGIAMIEQSAFDQGYSRDFVQKLRRQLFSVFQTCFPTQVSTNIRVLNYFIDRVYRERKVYAKERFKAKEKEKENYASLERNEKETKRKPGKKHKALIAESIER